MLKITNPRLGLSSPCPVASEIAYNGTQTGLPGNVQDAITQLDTNINIISNDYETKEVFTDISGETSGTVETYANISIMQEEWANEDNAIAVEISQGKPTENFLFTSQGEVIKATIDAYGNYTLDGIPTATDYAICYLLRGTKSAFGLAEIPQDNIISEYDYDSPYVINGTDIEPINLSYNLNLKNGGLKDTFVSTAIKLGDALNTAFSTVNKSIVGAVNELKAAIDNCLTTVSTDTTLIGNGTVASPLSVVNSSLIETATCSTAAATEAKTATLTNFSLTTGIKFRITFANTNTGAAPTLNINSLGAKPIADESGNAASATYPFLVKAGTTIEFTYDGTNFVYTNKVVKNYKYANDWYKIWSNGWIEQGGHHDHGSSVSTYNDTKIFQVAFLNTDYLVFLTMVDGNSQSNINAKAKSTTAFNIETSPNIGSVLTQRYADWEAKGF